MHILRGALIGSAFAAAVIATIVSYKSNSLEGGYGNATAAGLNSPERISRTTTPKDTRDDSSRPDAEYGWGPFRTVDW